MVLATNRPQSTGATGYIGGDALSVLSKAHPEFEFLLLIRTQDKADKVKAQYPKATIVFGDLDDSGLLREQAAKADIVLREYKYQSLSWPASLN